MIYIYSTYLGGTSDNDTPRGIEVDSAGNAYITGTTHSIDFPTTTGAVQEEHGIIPHDPPINSIEVKDAFVTKLNASGNAIVYSTYLGGNEGDAGADIALDSAGNAYITGPTQSTDFPTVNPYQSTLAGGAQTNQVGGDVFITKINASGSDIIYSTYLGGSFIDQSNSIAVDGLGNAYITGLTERPGDFPTTPGSLQESYGGGTQDCFVTKLSTDGASLVYSTYLGGLGSDFGIGIDVDTSGNTYVVGFTAQEASFPKVNDLGFSSVLNQSFAAKLNTAGNALVYSTVLEGGGTHSVVVDATGNAFIAGAENGNHPLTNTVDPIQATSGGGAEVYVMKLSSNGPSLLFSSYLGGSGSDVLFAGDAIALDSNGSVYVTGSTDSSDFPITPGAWQTEKNGLHQIHVDAFVAKIVFSITVDIDIKPGSDPNSINLNSSGVVPVAILSTTDFNAPTEVDPDTLALAGASVRMVGKSGKLLSHEEDVNGDDLLDLVCQFLTAQFLIEPGQSVAVMEGSTFGGAPIRGEDSIRIVPD